MMLYAAGYVMILLGIGLVTYYISRVIIVRRERNKR